MKKALGLMVLAVAMSLLVACAPQVPQSAKDAYVALKKVEGNVQSGVNYIQYMQAVGEANAAVNLFVQSKEAANHQPLAQALKNAFLLYRSGLTVWESEAKRQLISLPDLVAMRDIYQTSDPEYKHISAMPATDEKIERLRFYHMHLERLVGNSDNQKLMKRIWELTDGELRTARRLLEG